jgi:organic radical activating enzyme
MKHIFPRLDIMIAYSCNISCAGCISISDRKREGVASLEEITDWVSKWSEYVNPAVIVIFGGEPCIHPDLSAICKVIRTAWPNSTIRLITNGYLLSNFAANSWFDYGKFEIQVSVHRADHKDKINSAIKNILDQRSGWQVTQHNKEGSHKQLAWQLEDFTIFKSVFKDFVVPYQQQGSKILPWNSDPAEAYKICGAATTPILYKGRLYKCPPVANAIDLTGENWFGYTAYDINSDLAKFVDNINKPENVCSQCPSQEQAVVIDHFNKKNVIVKSKNIS